MPYLTGPSDFADGRIRHTKFTIRPTTICQPDDILVTVKGSGAGSLARANGEYCISRQLMAVRVVGKWDAGYVFAALSQNETSFAAAASGLIPGLSRNDILDAQLRFPPLAEQRSIAAALGDVDALLASLDKLIAKKRDLKQAAMQQLLTGKTRLPGFFGKWCQSTVGENAEKVGSGITPTGGAAVYRDSGPPFVRSQNVGWGVLLLDDVAYIDDDTHASFAATQLVTADVLLNITGASIGRSAVADERLAGGNVNQHVCIIRPKSADLDASFLNYFLLSPAGQGQVWGFQAGGNRQGLNFAQIRAFLIDLPPLPEQRAIAEILRDIDSELSALGIRRDKTHAIKQGMMQELLSGRTRLV